MEAEEKLEAVRSALKAHFLEREALVDGALAALLTEEHILILGPPGTAKSQLARQVTRHLDGCRYFEWLLTKFSTPEELFGPMSLRALEAGRYERLTTDKLPEAHIAFLDEIFKANSAILNALLTVLNERRFHQGSEARAVPLECLFAASNELPDEEELAALYDRFLLRFSVGYIEQDYKFARLLSLEEPPERPDVRLRPQELRALRERVARTETPGAVLRDVIELRRHLQQEGVVASDRRYRKATAVLRAAAVLAGRDRVKLQDLGVLEHILWSDPDDRRKVAEALGRVLSGFEEDAKRLVFQAREIEAYVQRSWPDTTSRTRAALEAHTKLGDIEARIASLIRTGRERGRDTEKLQDMLREVERMRGRLFEGQAPN